MLCPHKAFTIIGTRQLESMYKTASWFIPIKPRGVFIINELIKTGSDLKQIHSSFYNLGADQPPADTRPF